MDIIAEIFAVITTDETSIKVVARAIAEARVDRGVARRRVTFEQMDVRRELRVKLEALHRTGRVIYDDNAQTVRLP